MYTKSRWVITLFEWSIGIVGLTLVVWKAVFALQLTPLLAVFLITLAIVLEAIPIPLGKMTTTISLALSMGAIVVYGPSATLLVMVIAYSVAPFLAKHRPRLSTICYNAGQQSVSLLTAIWVLGCVDATLQSKVLTLSVLTGVFAGSVAYMVVNHSLVHLLNIIRGQFEKGDVVDALASDGVASAITLPFALLMATIGPRHPILAPLTMVPIVMLGQLMRVHRKSVVMQRVYETTTRLADAFEPVRLATEASRAALELVAADVVVTYVIPKEGHCLVPLAVEQSRRWQSTFNIDLIDLNELGVVQDALKANQWSYVPLLKRDSRRAHYGIESQFNSLAVFPLHAQGTLQGAMVCGSMRAYSFDELLQYINVLAVQLSVLLSNAALYQQMHDLSRRDGATGLFNYRYFYEILAERVLKASTSGQPLCVAIVDVDFFKKFNDTYGHLAGDAVLQSVGQLLKDLAGEQSIVARYGGEEFGIILPLSQSDAFCVMERIRLAIAEHRVNYQSYQLLGITVSIGIAGFPMHGVDDRELLLKADSAMYWGAKQQGRNRTAVYSPDIDGQLFIDSLTGLYTHHFIYPRVREDIARGVRRFGVVCVDLESFSKINEQFSFAMGDTVLQETSVVIRECLRHSEFACRYGGDEFLIVFPNVTTRELEVIGERIEKAISTHRFPCGDNVIAYVHPRVATACLQDVESDVDLFSAIRALFSELNDSRYERFGS